jgi:metal-responsive CopG/Arc/MetJ family transcriptional regulator
MRAHIVVSDELVKQVDELVGQRQRSRFFEKAVEEKLTRVRRLRAFDKVAGSLKDKHIPEWGTVESTIEWVRAGRRGRSTPAGS